MVGGVGMVVGSAGAAPGQVTTTAPGATTTIVVDDRQLVPTSTIVVDDRQLVPTSTTLGGPTPRPAEPRRASLALTGASGPLVITVSAVLVAVGGAFLALAKRRPYR